MMRREGDADGGRRSVGANLFGTSEQSPASVLIQEGDEVQQPAKEYCFESYWNPPDLTDHALALRELRLDPFFHRIAPDAYNGYVNGSLNIGREAAEKYVGQDPAGLAVQLGAHIAYGDCRMEVAGQVVRSEYDSGMRAITVYLPSAAEVEERLETGLLRSILSSACRKEWLRPGLIVDVHVAHELFHHLEATCIGRTDNRLPLVAMQVIGPFAIGTTRVRKCREIAAHAFVKELIRLPFLPNAFDILAQ